MTGRHWTFRTFSYLLLVVAFAAPSLVTPALVAAGGQAESEASAAPAATSECARVEFLVGTVTVDGVDAAIGDEIPAGATIVTGGDGRVEILFGSGNILELRPDTELTLDTTDPANAIDLRRGQFAAVFDRLETIGMGADDTFRVRTPATVAGVRGTAFFVAVESEDQTYVCTCNGTLNFGPDGDLTVTAARHEAYRFVAAANGASRREPAPELYHDTAEFNRLAEVVDVVIEWGTQP